MTETKRALHVAGDFAVDWHLARGRWSSANPQEWFPGDRTCGSWQPGGAALLGKLLESVAESLGAAAPCRWVVSQAAAVDNVSVPGDQRFHHSFAIWAPYPRSLGSDRHGEGGRPVWRVAEALGMEELCGRNGGAATAAVVGSTEPADIMVLDDAGHGFRTAADEWPTQIGLAPAREDAPDSPRWIVLKMAKPVADGALWEHLHRHYAHRLIVVITANDIRLTEVQISRALSWERTAQDVAWELVHNPVVNALSNCAHVVVSFDTAGAILMTNSGGDEDQRVVRLVFDPRVVEGTWRRSHPGGMIGYTTCLTAGICRELMLNVENPEVEEGVRRGLHSMRALHLHGYEPCVLDGGAGSPAGHDRRRGDNYHVRLAFPFVAVTSAYGEDPAPFTAVTVQDPVRFVSAGVKRDAPPEGGLWSILGDRYGDEEGLRALASNIVLLGAEKAIKDVPIGKLGNLLTVDIKEVESFRSIRELVGEYCRQLAPPRPLSIAVFGAPGAGKSFAVSEAVNSMLQSPVEKLTFNLSQFDDSAALRNALHRVRDTVLKGSMPLVFWDEFDSDLGGHRFGWLRHFLAPMADGNFTEGEVDHPIGSAIFVFAGSSAASLAEFTSTAGFQEAKGVDFVSRLEGFVDIAGPNRVKPTPSDPQHVVRRAILLRSILSRDAGHLFENGDGSGKLHIDGGVLRAFLQIPEYYHGARSMQSIIHMSTLTGRSKFERSCLPTARQLDLHVDGRHFLSLVQEPILEGEILECLARAAHDVYRESVAHSATAAPHRDTEYDDLPEEMKEQNRGLVRDIPFKLSKAGYVMVPARSDQLQLEFPGDALEKLAEFEHDRWMRAKVAAGWRYGDPRDEERNLHPALLPWSSMSEEVRAAAYSERENAAIGRGVLPEAQKNKDRSLVRAIPKILAKTGYAVVRVRPRRDDS